MLLILSTLLQLLYTDVRKTWTVILGQNAMTVNASVKEIQQEMESSVEVRNSPWKDCVLAFSGTYCNILLSSCNGSPALLSYD